MVAAEIPSFTGQRKAEVSDDNLITKVAGFVRDYYACFATGCCFPDCVPGWDAICVIQAYQPKRFVVSAGSRCLLNGRFHVSFNCAACSNGPSKISSHSLTMFLPIIGAYTERVVEMSAWPRYSCTTSTGTPSRSSSVAR